MHLHQAKLRMQALETLSGQKLNEESNAVFNYSITIIGIAVILYHFFM
ncbi:hypothetical protein [Bacillus sp. 165]|nr:hypothetical protein [Bacillus sp. 165]MBO9129892.1 hypothetical protein [Bacillus sp. 165]